MFPGKIPGIFTMSSSKLSYLISDGTGPYFNSLMVKYVTKSQKTPYLIHFDETTNNEGRKNLDIKIRYWSNNQNKIVIHHLRTYFLGHATGEQLANKLVSSLQEDNISLKQLQALESDGPNVNKTLWNNVNEVVLALPERGKGLVDIATCNLNVFHNEFSKTLSSFENSVSEFFINIHLFFKLSPDRKQDYKIVQEELGITIHAFLKHVDSRWLTLKPVLENIIEQWPGLIQ